MFELKIVEAYYQKASLYYFDKNDFRSALTYYKKIVDICPDYQIYQINLADCYDNLDMPKEAIYACDRSLECDEIVPAFTERAYHLKG